MSDPNNPPIPTIRDATEDDIPAIVSLVLTSFRQFPLFAFLYSPLESDKNAAHDTVFFWSRRVLVDLLDPTAIVQVAELSNERLPIAHSADQSDDPIVKESWRMLEWVQQNSQLTQASKNRPECLIIGFTIWHDRPGLDDSSANRAQAPKATWISTLRTTLLNLQTKLWSSLYTRPDQDARSYHEYEEAEDKLEQEFYREPCFYLDNLCVDFRYQRRGVGELLLKSGIEMARRKQLAIGTEASVQGAGLYRKLGFEQIGRWKVAQFEVPVMRLPVP